MTCRVYTIAGISYESPFPKDVLLQLIELQNDGGDSNEEVVEQLKLMNNSHQMFAGR